MALTGWSKRQIAVSYRFLDHLLPQVVVETVVEDTVSAADDRTCSSEGIPAEAEASAPIRGSCREDLLIAAAEQGAGAGARDRSGDVGTRA